MSGSELLTMVVLVGAALYVWAGILFFIPRSFTSLFRYELWKLRDQVFDDIVAGDAADHPMFWDLIGRIENYILHARTVTLIGAFVRTRLVWTPEHEERVDRAYDEACEDLPDEQRARLAYYEAVFTYAVITHFFRGSPVGWLGWVIALVTPRRRATDGPEEEGGVKPEPRVAPSKHARTERVVRQDPLWTAPQPGHGVAAASM